MVKSKILVVEDEAVTRATIVYFLERHDFDVHSAATAAAALAAHGGGAFDLALVDINLPGREGLTLADKIHRSSATAIIFISHCNEPSMRINALETTGDDYINKPLDLRELLARIRSVLRRRGHSVPQVIRVGTYDVDLSRRSVRQPGAEALVLTRGEFDLLAALIRSDGNIVKRETLIAAVSRDFEPSDLRTVDTLVSRLRRKLGDNPRQPRLIKTEQGQGYRLSPEP